jgi:hypothetical protein
LLEQLASVAVWVVVLVVLVVLVHLAVVRLAVLTRQHSWLRPRRSLPWDRLLNAECRRSRTRKGALPTSGRDSKRNHAQRKNGRAAPAIACVASATRRFWSTLQSVCNNR